VKLKIETVWQPDGNPDDRPFYRTKSDPSLRTATRSKSALSPKAGFLTQICYKKNLKIV
jgi:hypothetical protein